MTTTEVLIVCLTLILMVAVVAVAKWRMIVDAAVAEERREAARSTASAEERAARREADAAERQAWAAARARGPKDGTTLGVYVGTQLVKGTRAMRDDPAADGYIVLDDAELLEGTRATPLGGRQWITATGPDRWFQEL